MLEEIIPEVSKSYNLSDDPNDRAIAGASSGAVCAFTAAWERPDAFRRVFSTIGTYVGLRGGNEYPTLIRKFEPKPIRIFLQDGNNDLNIYAGDWWMANQSMLTALTFAGYDVKHAWGKGGHDGKQGSAVLPDALRWLWRDYGTPIAAGVGKGTKRRNDLLIPGEDWELVKDDLGFADGPAVNKDGEVFFLDAPGSKLYKVDGDKITIVNDNTERASGIMFDDKGNLFACQGGAKKVSRYDSNGKATTLVENTGANDLVVLPHGLYYTDHKNKKVWYINKAGKRTLADNGIEFPNGIVASPDQTQLYVSDTRGRFVYVFSINSDGTLSNKQQYGYLHIPAHEKDSGGDGMTVDTEGRVYVTTRMGVQVLDQLGRVQFIINKPTNGWLTSVVLGGSEMDELYLTIGKAVYKRRIRAKGLLPAHGPVKPPKPRL